MTILTPQTTASPTAATAALLAQSKKPTPTSLGMAKHPLPTEVFIFLGRKYLFAYPISHLCLLGFTFMFLNVNTLSRFGIFSSLMTGNILNATLALKDGDYNETLFKFTVILSHAVGGVSLDCYLMEYFKNRENTFGAIMLGLCIACVLVDLMYMDHRTDNHYVVCLLAAVCGALAHWSSKLGYVLMLHTGNMLKLSEALFLFLNGYTSGGPKMRGDTVLLFFLILSSLGGALLASLSLVYAPRASLIPILATIPLHLHLSGTTKVWGFPVWSFTDYIFNRKIMAVVRMFSREGRDGSVDSSSSGNLAKTPLASAVAGRGTITQLTTVHERDSNASNYTEEGINSEFRTTGVTPRPTTRKAYSIFERVEITPEELREFEDIVNSHNHRAQVTMS
jgi:uncharacterized membrane protein YoaK (UPF0700 family)